MQLSFKPEVKFIATPESLASLLEALAETSILALDIETAYWWDKSAEKISIIQIAIPKNDNISVWVIDCFSPLDLTSLQEVMINTNILKIIHNASFDVNKLRKLANIIVENVFDTMLAARRSGEKGCSLATLAMRHLGIEMDKSHQRSNWATRPLSQAQLEYAAKDAIVTLLLYEKVSKQGSSGHYQRQSRFSYNEERPLVTTFEQPVRHLSTPVAANSKAVQALIKIVMQFPGRYTVQSLAHCLGRERGGLPGFIVDNAISKDSFVDYKEALAIVTELLNAGQLVDRGRRLCVSQTALAAL